MYSDRAIVDSDHWRGGERARGIVMGGSRQLYNSKDFDGVLGQGERWVKMIDRYRDRRAENGKDISVVSEKLKLVVREADAQIPAT